MKSDNRQLSIYKVYIGDVPSDGVTMPAESAMTLIGHNIVPDSMEKVKDDDTYEVTKNQENNSIDMELLTEVGKTSINYATWDYNFENIVNVMGGEVVAGVWQAPTVAYSGREVCLKVISASAKGRHQVHFYPKVKMKGKLDDKFKAGEPGSVVYNFTLLDSEDSSGELTPNTQTYFMPAAPTFGIVDNTADTFGFTTVDGFTDVTKYEYSTDGGTSYSAVTSNPITGLTGVIAIGDLLVRVAAVLTGSDPYLAGYTLANKEAYS